jgi:hypothetical protein
MRPTVPEQLAGIRSVLAEVVAPVVADAYVADVLDGLLVTLDLLADAWADVPAFLRWDAAETAAVLGLLGDEVPPPPEDPLDLAALREHHRELRGRLERAVPRVLAHDAARTAAVVLFRARADRFPLTARPHGGFAAHAAR